MVSLFSCFDHFIGVFDYSVLRSMLSCNHERRQTTFSDKNVFRKNYCNLILVWVALLVKYEMIKSLIDKTLSTKI